MKPSVNVVIVTYRRPKQLYAAIQSLRAAAEHAIDLVSVGVTVVDDDPEGSAQAIAASFHEAFRDGCAVQLCGARNIARARNMGMEATVDRCDWIASIDDDVIVPVDWFERCLTAVADGTYNAVTGPLLKDFAEGPAWLTLEPFDQLGITRGRDGGPIDVCATGNNWISSRFVRQSPHLKFDPHFGVTGGEDTDFFYRAVEAGLRPVFICGAGVTEPQPANRCTLRYQVRRAYWLGLIEARVHLSQRKAGRVQLLARAARRAASRGGRQLSERDRARRGWRYTLTNLAQCVGLVLGTAGLSLRHK